MTKGVRVAVLLLTIILTSCGPEEQPPVDFTGAENEVKLMMLDPGHFHAALVQKSMYEQVDPMVYVFAPVGPDVHNYMQTIDMYNNRPVDPTSWQQEAYLGADYLEQMLTEEPGNVMITAGNNQKKTEYIEAAVSDGIHVLADKPMAINPADFDLLKDAFAAADSLDVILYDIMTERSEITTILQRELSTIPEVFGELVEGTEDNPAVTKESVHHFFKFVSGAPIQRPAWYFDTEQQGEGIVDVTTHLVDLIMWECFPNQAIDYQQEVSVLGADRWATEITQEQFDKVTGMAEFPEFLQDDIQNDVLRVYANGEINYTLRDVHARVSVIWNFQAPEGAGDTHYSIMRGTKAQLEIRQGQVQNYTPELYVQPAGDATKASLGLALKNAIEELQNDYPGLGLAQTANGWQIVIPQEYRVGHEAHFAQVMERFLDYLVAGELPHWEVPNMLAKYYTTTTALELARE